MRRLILTAAVLVVSFCLGAPEEIEFKRTKFPTPKPTSTSSPTLLRAPPTNVLLLIADDFKPVLKSFGSPHTQGLKMANLDQLSRDGITFRNAHAQMSICGPSRASFLTSLRPDTLRIYNVYPNLLSKYVLASMNSKKKKETLVLPKLFKLAGYLAYGVGKVFHENEYFLMGSTQFWTEPMFSLKRNGNRKKFFRGPTYAGNWISSPDVPDEHFADGQASRFSAKLITEVLGKPPGPNTSSMPWFLAVGLWKPHIPWGCPKKYFDMAGKPGDYIGSHNLTVEGLSPAQQSLAYGEGCSEVRAYNKGKFNLDARRTGNTNLQLGNHAYHATSLFMDAQMGIILDALNKSVSRLNTIVVFLGDHGFHLGDHGLYCKHTNFEAGTKVPLIIRPALQDTQWKRGSQSFAPVELLDLMPTLYDMAGLNTFVSKSHYQDWEGVSLMPILMDPENGYVKPGALSQYAHRKKGKFRMGYTIRSTRYRVTRWDKQDFVEFYDYLEDEWETKLVKDRTEVRNILLGQLRDFSIGGGIRPMDLDDQQAMREKPNPTYS
ncbi:hypothetical protein BASA81_010782 [Batrachochytrium salamandrivorans]|nr:hypothetical protein BASA81_010782 [Batrachochytrium salamandrivorans]